MHNSVHVALRKEAFLSASPGYCSIHYVGYLGNQPTHPLEVTVLADDLQYVC